MDRTRRRVGRPPRSEAGDTRAELMAAALKLFSRNGFVGTSIRAIAREVGLSESVLYSHFRNKQDIYQAAMRMAGPQGAITALDALDGLDSADPANFLVTLAERLFEIWDSPQSRQVASLLVRDGLLHDTALSDGIESAVARLAEVFNRWVAEGRLPADLGAAEDLAFALLAPIAHARMLWLHADASPGQRRTAHDRFVRHATLFARVTLGAPAPAE